MGFFKYITIFLLVLGYLTKDVQGIKCHSCNSYVTPDCSRDPLKLTEEITCAIADDTCIVAILSDGSTYRGCSSDLPPAEHYEPCGTDLCNVQIFPADRLKCFQCQKEPCVEVTAGSDLPCVNYDKDDQCFTDVIDETDVIRGCVSDYDYVNGVYSKNCTVSGCNNQPATTKFSCLKCDSTINPYCITGPAVGPNCFVTPQGTCESEVLLGRFALCFTYQKDEHVIRGCSSEEPEIVAQTRYIRECILQDCNDECIEAPQCYSCNSLTDPDCKDNLQNFEAETCPFETISCHTCRDEENIIRGCGNSEGLGVCAACWDDPGCNNRKMLECYSCTSETDPNCDLMTEPENIDKVICNGNCISNLRGGYVVRGCQSNSFDCQPSVICQSCSEDVCNDGPIPEKRLRCHQCDPSDTNCDDEQELEAATECQIIEDDDDMCYLYLNSDNKMVRGCTTDESYAQCQQAGRCVTCSGDGCNSIASTRKFSCLECDSETDPNCKTGVIPGPECAVTESQFCEVDVFFGQFDYCYTYHFGDHVRRGCSKKDVEISSQFKYVRECRLENCNDECIEPAECYVCDSQDDLKCIDGISELSTQECDSGEVSCHTCRREDSNIVRGCGKPDGSGECATCWDDPGCNNKRMLECYSCSSETDPDCELLTNPDDMEKAICNGNCISTLRGKFVIRGCQSNSFDCQTSLTCKSCTEDRCNDGLMPEKRPRCHQCDESDPNCNNEQDESSATDCELVEDEDDECYVYLNENDNLVRGCATDENYKNCEQLPGRCFTCVGDGCNSQSIIGKQTCLVCDSEEDEGCKTGPNPGAECSVTTEKSCEMEVPFSKYEYCYTYQSGEHVRRGCSKLDPTFSSQFKYVRECRFDNCNDECFASTKCYGCDSSTNENCISSLFGLLVEECEAGEISCHTCRKEDNSIVRGCGNGESGECAACWDDPGCNTKQMLECYSCTSETDPNCDLMTEPENIDKVICNGNCISNLREGYVVRGCQSNSFDCQPSVICQSCSEDVCNDGPIPEKRLRCHQCDPSDTNCDDEQELEAATECQIIGDDNDMCYVYLNSDNKMVRGCTTDESYAQCQQAGRCLTCSGDGCNSAASTRKFSCLECDSETDPNCKTGVIPGPECAVTESQFCEVDVFFEQFDYCYTYHFGEHVRRGCSKLDPTFSSQFKYVRECRFDNCNDECFASTKCYGCDSSTNENCISSLFGLLVEECEAGEISCHTCRKEDNSIVRGCGNGESGECAACWDDPGCNTKQMLECYSCTSETDPNCDLMTEPENIDKVICNGNCISNLREGYVVRGCQSNSFDCQPSVICQSCSEDVCNDGPIPEKRLRCHQCDPRDTNCDDEQELEAAIECQIIGDDNMCYLYLNSDNKMVRGCTTDESYAQCQQAGRCVTCSGDGCNSVASTSKFSCLECDSETDPNCKTGVIPGPECAVTESQFCEVDVFFGQFDYCYTYHFGDHVRRGCSKKDVEISSQFKYVRECRLENCNDECIESAECYVCDSQDDLKCIDGISELSTQECDSGEVSCHTCRREDSNIVRGCGKPDGSGECATCWDEPGCNNKKMLECYSCSSETDPDCELLTNPDDMEKAICNGNCISTLRGEYVIRGCQSNSFDCQTSLTCKSCTEDLCNDGLMPKKRPRCHQCDESDPNCNNEQDENSATDCELIEDEDDECYVYLNENDNLVRGCATDENYKNCEQLPGRCFTCVGDGCNSQSIIGKQTCLVCDSEEDEGCKTGPNPGAECSVTTEKSCEMEVPFSKYEYCYTYQSGEHVRRGCSKLDPTFSSQFKYVRECRFDNCNDECFASTKCYGCDSSTNENCISSLFGLLVEECEAGEISCHTCRKEDNSIVRGCGNGESGECAACWDDPGCNTKQMLECYTCTSETDPNCDLWTEPEGIDTAICNGNCIATIRDDHVIRGCQSTSFDCPASSTCKSCTEDRCNGGRIPEAEGLRCHQCGASDPNCDNEQELSTATVCPASGSTEDGKCYLYMNEDKKMVRGCTTDISYRECEELDKGRCVTCSGDGCNSEAKISELTCIVCDSENDPSCKGGAFSGPECAVVSENSCKVEVFFTEYEYCYTHRFGERIQRGCSKDDPELASDYKYVRECRLNNCNDECFEATECYVCDSQNNQNCIESTSELSTQECNNGEISCHTCRNPDSTIIRGCGDGESGECAACWDDPGCNNKKMLECYSCTSANDPNCEEWTQPEQINKEICNGNCITTLRDGNIIRGCQSINFDCQPSATCNSCSEDLCNAGQLLETRHRCHQCDETDPNCDSAQDESSAQNCPVLETEPEEDQDTCYLYLNNNNNMVRGCIADENYRICEQLGEGCVRCSGNGCNSQPTISQLTCLVCDSDSDPGCKTGPNPGPACEVTTEKTCVVDVLFGQYEYCYRYHFGERVRRGCSKLDTEISSQQNYVRECRLEKCNDDCIEAAKCYICDSITNPDCIDVNFSLGIQDCTADSVSCHTCRDSAQVIRRGCGAGDTFGQCASCWNDPGCNNKKMLSCYSCDSQEDANCADWTNPDRIEKTICNGNCIATVRDGFVVRGCQSNSFDCPISATCNNCNEDDCNGGLIPANRIRCHQCDENDANCNDAKDETDAPICPDFNNDDQCFLFLNNNDKMVRGCTSDSRYKECQASNERCITCSESGCNSIAALKEPTFSCANCSGGDACLWWQTDTKKCEKQIPYYAKETCFTYHPTADAVTRGCTLDGNGCDSTSMSCQICSSEACNTGNRVYQSCLQCTGKNKEDCVDGEKIVGDSCSRTEQLFETRGCYAKREGDTVTRGCLYELTTEEKTKCDEDKNCETCLDQNCNTKKLSNSATQSSALSALILALVAYFVKIRI